MFFGSLQNIKCQFDQFRRKRCCGRLRNKLIIQYHIDGADKSILNEILLHLQMVSLLATNIRIYKILRQQLRYDIET